MLAVAPPVFSDDLARIAVAVLLGGVLGFERQWHGHWAGLRTHILVAMGCAIFVICGMDIVGRESEAVTRVIQGIASGVGFLGAGTILKLDQKETIKGLTTAGSIWLAAALGTSAGSGEYALASAAAIISFLVLAVLGPAEKYFEHRHKLHKLQSEDSAGLQTDAN
ncbi:MAG TPA: MgtC/SapB family protein [Lacipirellulaceae bacterium]|nr:MgtC/SapB family protein [Lacipirellulaceae bacterium]